MDDEEPRGIPLYGDDSEPLVDDPALPYNPRAWSGANPAARKLQRCLESIRDVRRQLASIAAQPDPAADRYGAKQLVTPLYNLALSVRDLYNEIQANAPSYDHVSAKEQAELRKQYERFSALVLEDGALRMVRDKLAAHVDRDIYAADPREVWTMVSLVKNIGWLDATYALLFMLLGLDAYAWTRGSSRPDSIALMTSEPFQLELPASGELGSSLPRIMVVKSPRYAVEAEMAAAARYAVLLHAKVIP